MPDDAAASQNHGTHHHDHQDPEQRASPYSRKGHLSVALAKGALQTSQLLFQMLDDEHPYKLANLNKICLSCYKV